MAERSPLPEELPPPPAVTSDELQTLREEVEIAHALLDLGGVLAEIGTLEDTLQRAVYAVAELFDAERAFAVARVGAPNRFAVRAATGYDELGLEILERLAAAGELPLVAGALDDRSLVFSEDVLGDGRLTPEGAAERSLGAFIAIPLMRGNEVLGGLGIEYPSARRFTPAERSLAAGVARQVGVALGNARRYGLLTGLRSFGLRTGAQLRLGRVIEEVVLAACDLLDGDDATVYMLDANRNVLVPVSGPAGTREDIGLDDGVWGALHSGRSIFIPEIDVPHGFVCAVATGIPKSNLEMMGALVVLFRRLFDLGADEAEALRVAAAQAAIAIENAQRFERQQSVARSLQRGLMAVQMPELAGCEVAAIYEPAASEADIGGDFFDVFEVDGAVGVVVGDVSGKGAEAAAQTAMAKYMLRAFAMRSPRPASVLHHLNNALVQSMGEDRFTTVVYALFEPDEQKCEIVAGGHPPPLHYRRAEGDVLDIPLHGSILGAFRDESYASQVLEIQPGDALVAFTDGLVEARSGDELYGRSRVKESLARHGSTASAQDLVRLIHDDARAFGNMGDDTIVFALRCPDDPAR
jgi:serine phosphatase RsbU (regulator of sigma subunit)